MMTRQLAWIAALAFAFVVYAQDSSVSDSSVGSSETDVLLAMAEQPSFPLTWSGSNACDEGWEGVVCAEGVVTGLDFSGSDIGYDASFLSDLHELQNFESLILKGCGLTSLPPITQLTLRHIDLSENNLSNDISEVLGDLLLSAEGLKSLLLRDSGLSGDILTSSIEPFVNLVYVDLSHNMLTGSIPSHFFELPHSLQFLYLNDNNFSGALNFDSSVTLNIRSLWVQNNQLSGDFPSGTSLGASGNFAVLSELRISSSGLQTNMTMISEHMPFFLEVFARSSELLPFDEIYGVSREDLFAIPRDDASVAGEDAGADGNDQPSFVWEELNYWSENCLEMSYLLGASKQSSYGRYTFPYVNTFGFVNLEGLGHPELDGHPSTRDMADEKCVTVAHKQGMNYATLLSDGSCTGLWKAPFWHNAHSRGADAQFDGFRLNFGAVSGSGTPKISHSNGTEECPFWKWSDSIYFHPCYFSVDDPTLEMHMHWDGEWIVVPHADGKLESCDTITNPVHVIPSDQGRRRLQNVASEVGGDGDADVVWLSEPASISASEEFCLPGTTSCQTVLISGSFDPVTCCSEYCERLSVSEKPPCCDDSAEPCGVDIFNLESVSIPTDLEAAIEESNTATADDNSASAVLSDEIITTSPATATSSPASLVVLLTCLGIMRLVFQ